MQEFTARVLGIIKTIPSGQVMTYGQVAAWAGNPRAARQVSRFLRTYSRLHQLPWHRVINAQGKISLPPGGGFEKQFSLLQAEGVEFGVGDRVDLQRYGRQN